MKNVIIYPIFLRCCSYLRDPFWIYLFEDLAYGKSPHGVIIQNGSVYSILKNREFRYIYENKREEEITDELSTIFSEKLNILSEKDYLFKRQLCQKYYDDMVQNVHSWNDIKKKKIKDLLLEQYVLNIQKKFNYSIHLTHQLYSIIFIGIQFKTIQSKDIIYEAGNILDIDGIQCVKNKVICSKNIFITKNFLSNDIKIQKPTLSWHWKKFIMTTLS